MEFQKLEGMWKLSALKDTSQAPQAARSRILPEPKSIKAIECKEKLLQICTSCCMPELNTRAEQAAYGLGELRPSAQEPCGEHQWPKKGTQ
jgi:hypothetical protein